MHAEVIDRGDQQLPLEFLQYQNGGAILGHSLGQDDDAADLSPSGPASNLNLGPTDFGSQPVFRVVAKRRWPGTR